jgi:hypothetical protein
VINYIKIGGNSWKINGMKMKISGKILKQFFLMIIE